MDSEGAGDEEASEDQAGTQEQQADEDKSGAQKAEKDDNLPIDNTDKKPQTPEQEEGAGGDQARDEQEAGSAPDQQQSGGSGAPDEITEEEAEASEAVDQFDQLGEAPGLIDPEAAPGELPDPQGGKGNGVSLIMMEQWLERIEGDPAYLLRNQFMIEERLELERNGRRLIESRPW
jgi:Ca-activated chloride channel family protein